MNRKIVASIIFCVLIIGVFAMTVGLIPTIAVAGTCDQETCCTIDQASGTWTYTAAMIDTREVGDYTYVFGEENSTLTGTFEGTSYDVFIVVVDPSGIRHLPTLTMYFEGEVNGKSGTLTVMCVGVKSGDPQEWFGDWEIISGTGDLIGLQGEGTWWGPSGSLSYEGQIHFGCEECEACDTCDECHECGECCDVCGCEEGCGCEEAS